MDVLTILEKLNGKNLESSLNFIDSLKLDDETLRKVVDTKYSTVREINEAYKKFGSKIVAKSYRNLLTSSLESGNKFEI